MTDRVLYSNRAGFYLNSMRLSTKDRALQSVPRRLELELQRSRSDLREQRQAARGLETELEEERGRNIEAANPDTQSSGTSSAL